MVLIVVRKVNLMLLSEDSRKIGFINEKRPPRLVKIIGVHPIICGG